MRKIFVVLSILFITFSININSIGAKEFNEIYYINDNNVSLTKEQYDYFSKMYYEGYQKSITLEEFNSYSKDEMKPELVKTNYVNNIQLFSSSINTLSKNLKISSSPSASYKRIVVVATWTTFPSKRSNDLIGAYLSGISLYGGVTTTLEYSGGSYTSSEIQNFNNGFGVSIKLPTSGSNIIISQTFRTTTGGIVYASYQHATSNVTLFDSKNYTIGYGGYGHVFEFTNGMGSRYDAMSGVYIDV